MKKKTEDAPRPKPTPAHPEVVAGQIFAAFGQGAVLTPLADDAVRYLRKRYSPKARKFGPVWSEHRARQILIAREVGRLAAAHAATHGRYEITGEDVQAGLLGLDAGIAGMCPWS